MSYYFHAVAIDYDGTLADGPRPSDGTLGAVRAIRQSGRKCILVTGRILDELRADFPDVDGFFDAIVGENGAVLSNGRGTDRALVPAIEASLARALVARGVPVRRGMVLLASDAAHGAVINDEIARLGLDAQIVRNRAALMVLPAGVTKGTGVVDALDALGLSQHSTVGIGDAENDHSLLAACEIGVVVANAIPSLGQHADLVLAESDGEGVATFLRGPFISGLPGLEPRRWHLDLGTREDGRRVTIPASRVNVEIYGESGVGKSYLAGLIAEQLVGMRYTVCVLDLEGDHVALADLHGVVAVGGGGGALPEPSQIGELLVQGLRSVVVDLSLHGETTKRDYSLAVLAELHRTRRETGIPHWILVEEAHIPLRADHGGWWCRDTSQTGLCIVTYRPELVCRHLTARAEVVIAIEADGTATIGRRGGDDVQRFTLGSRGLSHVRHWHKYVEGALPLDRQFHFRDSRGLTGRTAGNVTQFVQAIERASRDTLRHHASNRDFSRWLGDLCQSGRLPERVRELEGALAGAHSTAETALFRTALLQAVEHHFGG